MSRIRRSVGVRVQGRFPGRGPLRPLAAGMMVTVAAGGFALLAACGSSSDSNGDASTQPVSPPATRSVTGSVPSELSSLLDSGKAVASSAAASASSAAASFEASVEAHVGKSSAAAKQAVADATGKGNATGDVGLTGLPKGQTGNLHAVVVTITNRTAATASFAVKVEFADTNGKVVDSTIVSAPDLAKGAKAQPVAFTTKDLTKTLFPRVAVAQRF